MPLDLASFFLVKKLDSDDSRFGYEINPGAKRKTDAAGMIDLVVVLNEIEQSHLVHLLPDDDLSYLFNHVLTQEAAYESVLLKTRRELHRSIAEAYEYIYPDRIDANSALLVRHYSIAGDHKRVVESGLRAGANSLRVNAVREALTLYEQVLAAQEQMPDGSPQQAYEALMGWAEAAFKIRPYSAQLEYLSRAEKIARALNDKARLARALYRTGRVQTAQGHNLRSIEPLAECFTISEELGDRRLLVLPTFSMGLAVLDASPRQAIEFFDQAIKLAKEFLDEETEAVIWSTKAMAHARLGQVPDSKRSLDAAYRLLGSVESLMTASDVYLFAAWAYLELGELEKGHEAGSRCVEAAEAADNLDCVCGAFDGLGFNRLVAGNVPDAMEAFREAIRRSEFSGAELFENMGRGGLAIAEYFGGRENAIDDLIRAYERAKALDDGIGGALFALALGGIYSSRSEFRKAEELIQDALAYYKDAELTPHIVQALEALANLYTSEGRVLEAERARADARELTQRMAPSATTFGVDEKN